MTHANEEQKRPYLPIVLRVGLAIFLLFSSAAILYTTARNLDYVQTLSTQALESTALALCTSAETALYAAGNIADAEMQKIFSDRVVAYALIAGEDGKILFHTNPDLVGSYMSNSGDHAWPSKTAEGRRIELKTGLPAYAFNYILRLPDSTTRLLRLVLYTTSADRIVNDARKMWWTVGVVLILLWAAGIMLDRIFVRHSRLQQAFEQRYTLSIIGQMTAVLAHEIKNALGSVKGYVQWVHEKMEGQDPKKQGLSIVLKGVERIEKLISDLLRFSRQEQYRVEPLDPLRLIQEVMQSEPPSWKGKVNLEGSTGTLALGDPEKLYHVFLNGIQNAVQAMGSQGQLHISVNANRRWVRIQLEDTGPGIPAEEIPRLFTPFHTTKTDGTGLGLAYSKKVVEGMGGTISLANREGTTGAVLRIQLAKAKEDKISKGAKDSRGQGVE